MKALNRVHLLSLLSDDDEPEARTSGSRSDPRSGLRRARLRGPRSRSSDRELEVSVVDTVAQAGTPGGATCGAVCEAARPRASLAVGTRRAAEPNSEVAGSLLDPGQSKGEERVRRRASLWPLRRTSHPPRIIGRLKRADPETTNKSTEVLGQPTQRAGVAGTHTRVCMWLMSNRSSQE
jgi:hypothetical protein